MKKLAQISSLLLISVFALPVLAANATNFKDLVKNVIIDGLIKPVVPLLIGLAVVVFIYGVIVLMFSQGGEKKEEGKQYMLWGLVGIFVMVSVWGLVAVLTNTFGLDNTYNPIQIHIP